MLDQFVDWLLSERVVRCVFIYLGVAFVVLVITFILVLVGGE